MSEIPQWVYDQIDDDHERLSYRERKRHADRMYELAESNQVKGKLARELYPWFIERFQGQRIEYWWSTFLMHVFLSYVSGDGRYNAEEHLAYVRSRAEMHGELLAPDDGESEDV